jgi:hypothetical protein
MTMDEIDEKRIAAKRHRSDELEAGNLRSYNELGETMVQEFNQSPQLDTSDMRRELLIEHLIKAGALTEEQALDFEIAFHLKVEEKLNEVWEQVREAIKKKKAPKLAVVKKGGVLLDQHGRAITGQQPGT